MAHDPDVYQHVKSLIAEGISDYRIAKLTAIPRATVRNWRLREDAPCSILRRQRATSWKVPDDAAYCYLLGVYLGDGTVCVKPPNSAWLQVVNDRQYTAISDEIMMAMQVTFPDARPRSHPSSTGESDVLCISHPAIPHAFPQCGRGRKHLRRIVLEAWQVMLTHTHPGALVRGLIHSDGCRTENRFHTKLPSGRIAEYGYVRYFFSNLSADIRQIFVEHCELMGVRVTQSNHRNLSVSHGPSVAILDAFVGPKS